MLNKVKLSLLSLIFILCAITDLANCAQANCAEVHAIEACDAPSVETSICKRTGFVVHTHTDSFDQYQTKDKFDRTITFYINGAPSANEKLPLILYIIGSGGGSVFHVDDSYYEKYLAPVRGKACFILVEKPGVKLYEDHGGSAENCSEEFLREHTLDRWTEANNAALRAAQTLPGIDRSRLLVIGHSEGGQVATHVAATNPRVTHVASFGSAGPTQLFDVIYKDCDDPDVQRNIPETDEHPRSSTPCVEEVRRKWSDIVANKDSITKFWGGHPYRRWYSFCTSSPIEDILSCSAKVYLVNGTKDTSVPIASFDVKEAELMAHGREFVAERIDGADHSLVFNFEKPNMVDELPNVVKRVMAWFFE